MKEAQAAAANIDDYIAAFPADVQDRLQVIRRVVRRLAPDAVEKISYRIPTFARHGNLVHFAAFKHHIGLYPGAAAIETFAKALADYRTSKGAIQLPLEQPLPLSLIEKIVRFRIDEQTRNVKGRNSR
ncbi:MAG: DUF1801 domain-containing protein [Betaproteobacteria bacterium]